ncbi:MAG: DNA-binding protein [Candidatus Woesearchaeota archaeon]
MNIEKYYNNIDILDKKISAFIKKKKLERITKNDSLVRAHIEKAKHNYRFFKKNSYQHEHFDWLIVILYYTLYHTALALLVHKQYVSKNHTATLCVLIKEYGISKKELLLFKDLRISKDDAQLYTTLKKERQKASYTTHSLFSNDRISDYSEKVLTFLEKAQDIITADR